MQNSIPCTQISYTFRPHGYVSGFVYKFFPHVSSENGHLNAFFQKRNPQWRFFKTLASPLRVHGRERRFLNTMMSYIIYTTSNTLSAGCVSDATVFPSFWRLHGRTGENDWNTLPVDAYFFKNIRICVDIRGLILTSNKLFPSVFNC